MESPFLTNDHRQNSFDSWFLHQGRDFDTVLSSRVSLIRNLDGEPFPQAPQFQPDLQELQQVMELLCSKPWYTHKFHGALFSNLEVRDRELLVERRLASNRILRQNFGAMLLDEQEAMSITLFLQDHFRFSLLRPGFTLEQPYQELIDITQAVEQHYPFATHRDFGFLTSQIDDSGRGLRSSVMLQFTMLQELEDLEPSFFELMKKGYSIRGFTDNKEKDQQGSLGGFYQIYSPSETLSSEAFQFEDMERDIQPLILRERELRDQLKEGRYPWIEDKINRSFGILKYCKLLSAQEAQKRLSFIRLGITLGWIDGLSLEEVSALLILVQDSHIASMMEENEKDHPFLLDERRARFIREVFETGLPYRR